MRIQHNIMAMNAYNKYTNNVNAMKKNLEKLSSGYKINRAGDDAAGLAISEKMRAQITGLETAQKNAKDGISLVQTAEGALTEVHDMLNRMVTLATQSANGTYDNDVDRVQLQKELDQLRTEINRIADSTNFNGIKLFDGSLSGADITTEGITTTQIDMAKGVDIVQGDNGGGSKGVYCINLNSAMTDGDQITVNFGGKYKATNPSLVFEYNSGTNKIDAATTIEGQAQNLANALKSKVGSEFDIVADGTSITLTSKLEGNDETKVSTITGVSTTTDLKATAKSSTTAVTQKGADDTKGVFGFGGLFEGDDSTASMNISDGDTINIEVTLEDGSILSLSAVAGKDFEVTEKNLDNGTNLVNFLTSDNAVFTDNSGTVVDESKIKFKDILTATVGADTTAKTSGLKLQAASGLVKLAAGGSEIKITNNKANGDVFTASRVDIASSDAASGTAAKAAEYDLTLDTAPTDAAANLTIGDKVTIEGKLTDGRTFKVEAEAGKDFMVGKDYTTTLTNLNSYLTGGSGTVQLKDSDGNDSGSPVKLSEIFGDSAEIKLDTANKKFVSNKKGTIASNITNVSIENSDALSVSSKLKNGDQQSSADSTITFNEGTAYGAVIEVGGKNYELVKSAADLSNSGNQAVIVDDISNTSAVAKALANAVKGNLPSDYTVTTSNNSVIVSSTKTGSSAKAISVSSSGDKTTQVEFTLDPKKMQSGTTVTINGQTYEFVDKNGKLSSSTNQKIAISDFSKETASTLGAALQNAANQKNNASVTVDSDGKVTVRGLLDPKTDKIVTPTVKFDGGTSGLTLQIGETADEYNKMRVSIYNMHVADMGVGDISILDQDSAGAAIDKIRSAINYVSDVRGSLGATQNRLDHTINNLAAMQENIQDAESTIRDTDIAAEMMAYTKNNILIQSSQAMLAQANQVPQGVLQLLQ